ncbi:Ribonuclease P/MRP protein subunit POP5 [Metarhizium anisopliae]|nr:Ribonuclease P/MRP protein subunit POP5 [Metarhizium anisopliae]
MVRIKERYLLVNIIYPPDATKSSAAKVPSFIVQHQPTLERVTPRALLEAIRTQVGLLFGDSGLGALEGNLSVKYLSLATSTFILRCHRAHYQILWSALTFMDHVPAKDGRPCIFRVVRVSGTIRKAEEEAIRQARQLILAAKEQASSGSQISQTLRFQQDESMLDIVDDGSDLDNATNEDEV